MTTHSESRDFRISNNTIFHLISSQAGTKAKALMELVMNSSDAKSDIFKLTIDNEGFVAEDTGIGFRTRDEIEAWFEELGFAHDSDLHQEDDRLSRFGLGRAQIFCFAPTVWQTNDFQMEVDIQKKGLGYDLSRNPESYTGCKVSGKWYEPLSFSDLKEVLREFEELVAYAGITIEVNGRLVNKRNVKWDYDTDTVRIKRREAGDLYVYNKGYLVKSYPAHTYGSGVVVSKGALTLNIARNDILTSQCSIWKEVRKFLREEQAQRTQNKTRLTDDERQFMIDQFVSGELEYSNHRDAPIIEDVSGRKSRFSRLSEGTVTVHTSGNKLLADRIHQSKAAFVMSGKMLDFFGVDSAQELISQLNRIVFGGRRSLTFVPIEELINEDSERFVVFKDKELTKTEAVALKALRVGMGHLHDAVWMATSAPSEARNFRRKLFIGDSEGQAKGWTDGRTFIALDRSVIKHHVRDGWRGFTGLVNIIVHELCHEHNTATAHDHGEEFYEAFHAVLCDYYSYGYGTALRQIMSQFLGSAQKENLKLSRNEIRDLDREVAIERDVYEKKEFITMVQGALFE